METIEQNRSTPQLTLNEEVLSRDPEGVLAKAREVFSKKLAERQGARDAVSANAALLNPFAATDKDNGLAINALIAATSTFIISPTIAITEGPGNMVRLIKGEVGVLREKLRLRKLEKKFG